MIGLIFVTAMAQAENVPWRMAAEGSYKLFVGNCPKAEPIKSESAETEAIGENECDGSEGCRNPKALSADVGKASEGAYLASLAEMRSESHACSLKQLGGMLEDPAQMKAFQKDLRKKLPALFALRRKYDELIEYGNNDEVMQVEVGIKAIEASIPFFEYSAIKSGINRLQRSFTGAFYGHESQKMADLIDEKMKGSVKDAAKAVMKDFRMLSAGVKSMGTTLPTEVRESLIQDTDLVEAFRRKHKDQEKALQPVACRLDAKYGRGARMRDDALMVTTLIGGGLSLAAKGGAAALTALNAARYTATSANLIRSAGALMAVAGGLGGVQTGNKAWNVCVEGEGAFKGDPNRCEANAMKAIAPHSCLLNLTMTALAAGSAYPYLRNVAGSMKATDAVVAAEALPVIDEIKMTRGLASAVKTEGAVSSIEKVLPQVRGEANVQRLVGAIDKADDIAPGTKATMKDALIVGAEREAILHDNDNILNPLIQRIDASRRSEIAEMMAKLTKNGQVAPEKVANSIRKACVRAR